MALIDILKEERIAEDPFLASNGIKALSSRLRKASDYSTARSIFDWVIRNISYKDSNTYKGASSVLKAKEGVCAEQAALYIAIARCCSLEARYVSVTKDNLRKKVSHACAAVKLHDGWLLVDTVYQEFDIRHRNYSLVEDDEVKEMFRQWNA